jgi:hypothetical protein
VRRAKSKDKTKAKSKAKSKGRSKAESKTQSMSGPIPEDLRAAFRKAVWSYADWNPALAEPEVPLR